MKTLITYIVESGICLFGFWLIHHLCLRKETFFNVIRGFLLFGIMASFVLPFFHFTYEVTLSPTETYSLSSLLGNSPPTAFTRYSGIDIFGICTFIYISGIMIQLITLIIAHRKVIKLIHRGCSEKKSGYTLIDNPAISAPFSVYGFIFFNSENVSGMEKYTILTHEESHIRQKHWLDLMFCELLVLFQWFNPFAWKYVSAIKENHEFLADESVLKAGIPINTYREVLVNQTLQRPLFTFTNLLNYKHSIRFKMMHKEKSSAWKKEFILLVLPLFGILMWASAKPHYVVIPVSDNVVPDSAVAHSANKVLLFIDGKEYPGVNLSQLDTVYFESTSLLDPDKAVEKYGEKGKNGIMYITLKKGFDYTAFKNPPTIKIPTVYIIDGKESSEAEVNKLSPSQIESLEVKKSPDTEGKEVKSLVIISTKKR